MASIYLMFNGNCREAIRAYESAFGTKVQGLQKYSDMPPDPNFPVSEAEKDLVLHSRLDILGTEVMCSDSTDCGPGSNMYVSIAGDEGTVRKAWDVLKKDGIVYMELAPAFFAKLHGSLRDKFGVNWMFSVDPQGA
ncbi:MAG: VOC family protein [Treponema sp.]|nr:VOC family protein [Treponema sp.]